MKTTRWTSVAARTGWPVLAGMLTLTLSLSAGAQPWPQNPGLGPPSSAAPASPAQTPVCARLEAQLSALDRGAADPVRAEQIRRYEESAAKQQFELDRTIAQARRSGCEGSGFFLFGGGQPPQCDGLNAQIQRMRMNLDKINMDLQRLQSGSGDRADQRRAILLALGQNDCGPQYRAAAVPPRPRGLFETLFGGSAPGPSPAPDFSGPEGQPLQGGGYRTICVRTCDGYYFPISFSTTPAKFADDERLCQQMCPASEVILFTHRNPGEDVSQAVSLAGRGYRELPNAFRYRSEFNAACSCKRPGQSWAEAMGDKDATVERGDIVVTEDRAKAMSQPREPPRQDTRKKGAAPQTDKTPRSPSAPAPEAASEPAEKRPVRSVGPNYYPAR